MRYSQQDGPNSLLFDPNGNMAGIQIAVSDIYVLNSRLEGVRKVICWGGGGGSNKLHHEEDWLLEYHDVS